MVVWNSLRLNIIECVHKKSQSLRPEILFKNDEDHTSDEKIRAWLNPQCEVLDKRGACGCNYLPFPYSFRTVIHAKRFNNSALFFSSIIYGLV